ncbi:MAG: RrF2 family transcriptional regulator [Candidatus Bipolaricaulaceae bacterium]
MSEAAALALHAMVLLAEAEGPLSVAEIARRLRASGAHVAKVMGILARANLVEAKRGPAGGYFLARPAEEIRLLEIYEVFEGELRRDRCVFASPVCISEKCVFGGLLEEVRKAVHAYLANTTLADVAGKGDGCPGGSP